MSILCSAESMINNYSESVEKQIQTGIAYAKRCLLENRSGVIVAVLSAGRKSEKCDTVSEEDSK